MGWLLPGLEAAGHPGVQGADEWWLMNGVTPRM